MNILLIEDDPGIGRFVSRGLAGKGYRVAWERSGERAVELLTAGGFAAVLLDLGLPDGDGLTLCRVLREAGVTAPILMLTARAALQDRLDGFEVGADDYLPKPFAFEELVARLAAIVRRGAAPIETPLAFATLSLNREERAAIVGDRHVTLSHREYELLAALVAGGGNVVSRATLTGQVWGENGSISDNVLDVYIGYLRRHLATIPSAPQIETLRGRGYRLVGVA